VKLVASRSNAGPISGLLVVAERFIVALSEQKLQGIVDCYP